MLSLQDNASTMRGTDIIILCFTGNVINAKIMFTFSKINVKKTVLHARVRRAYTNLNKQNSKKTQMLLLFQPVAHTK